MKLNFLQLRNQAVRIQSQRIHVGDRLFQLNDELELNGWDNPLSVQALLQAAEGFRRLVPDFPLQFGALAFTATGNPRALDFYFPITQMLTETEIPAFYGWVESIARHPNFNLQLIGEHRALMTHQMPSVIRQLVAGQLAEVFFVRRDILEQFLRTPRHFQLYASQRAFEGDGGAAGGDYNPGRQSIQLVVSRLFEGFFGETAGVCPLLHELGHMLDHFDVAAGKMGKVEGLLPSLSPRDGHYFNPQARKLFLAGKRLELERYLSFYQRKAKRDDPLPIGHPYVFQNDGEFIAGYFEMFFRNPNYFASQNETLYAAFVGVFGYDPRKAWKQDFPYYIDQNRDFYLSGSQPWKPGLTIPQE